MSTKSSGLTDRFFVAGYDLSTGIASFSKLGKMRAEQDVTGLDKFAHERLQLLEDGEIDAATYYDGKTNSPILAHQELRNLAGLKQALYFRGETYGSAVAALLGHQFTYDLTRSNTGALLGSASLKGSQGYGLDWCQALSDGNHHSTADEFLTPVATRYPFGSTGELLAYLQVFDITGTDLVVRVQHSDYSLDAIAEDDDAVLLNTNLLNNHTYAVNGVGYGPDGRHVEVTIVDTTPSIVAGTVHLIGTALDGTALTENLSIAGGAGVYTSTNRFLTVTSVVTLNDVTVLGGSGDEKIKVGVAAVAGAFSNMASGSFGTVSSAPYAARIVVPGPVKAFLRASVGHVVGFTSAHFALAVRAVGPSV